jgi:hypothetical protein
MSTQEYTTIAGEGPRRPASWPGWSNWEVAWVVVLQWCLGRWEARKLAQRVQDELDAAAGKTQRVQRLQRVLRRVLRRAQRRLRAEVREREG